MNSREITADAPGELIVRVRCGRCRTGNVAVFDAKGET